MEKKLLNKFPKPLLDDLLKDKWLPIIGAGFSKNADFPSNLQMPSWEELGKLFANEMENFQFSDPIESISSYSYENSRNKLIEKLTDYLLIDVAQPGSTHKAFCEIPFDIILTTNFDFLIDKQFERSNKPFYPLLYEDQLGLSLNRNRVCLVKVHGDLNHPKRMVITEDDYDIFIDKYPLLNTFIASILITRNPIFIGYSLNDPDFRQIWKIIINRLGELRKQAYALLVDPSQQELNRFKRRGINVIALPKINSYRDTLEIAFRELSYLYNNYYLDADRVKVEDLKSEISIQETKSSRLCYFSIPNSMISEYKEIVFPIVYQYGYVPITFDDYISPGDNWIAQFEAILRKAAILVLDTSLNEYWLEMELNTGIRFVGRENILLISYENSNLETTTNSIIKITRPKHLSPFVLDSDPSFIAQLHQWFKNRGDKLLENLETEPKRHFDAKEYRAATISAITLLETKMRNLLISRSKILEEKFYTLGNIIRIAFKSELINGMQYENIKEWIAIRNKAVHMGQKISKQESQKVILGVYDLINTLTI